MDTIYLLQHVRSADTDDEDVKTIGAYRSEDAASAAIVRLGEQPGFRDFPDGWFIDAMLLDQDHWTEGFIDIPYEEL